MSLVIAEEIDLDQFPTTPHGTSIIDEMDTALEGSWVLVECYIHTSNGKIAHPFAGRTLTIDADGSFVEDFSTEFCRNESMHSQYDVVGRTGGVLKISLGLDLDVIDDPNTLPGEQYYTELVMRREPVKGPSPLIKSRGIEITNAVTHPLGAGRIYDIGDGLNWVKYDYELEYSPGLDTWPKLKLSTTLATKVTWVFRRTGTPEFPPQVPLTTAMSSDLWWYAEQVGLPEEKEPMPGLDSGEFTIIVTKSGSPPLMLRVTELTTVNGVRFQAQGQLGLTHNEFDLKIAGKTIPETATMADLGFLYPGDDFPGPVGNIIVREKNED